MTHALIVGETTDVCAMSAYTHCIDAEVAYGFGMEPAREMTEAELKEFLAEFTASLDSGDEPANGET